MKEIILAMISGGVFVFLQFLRQGMNIVRRLMLYQRKGPVNLTVI
jgi:hypothetical protein